jgi:DNA-binding transcriptional LysR family regulator
MDLDDIRLFVKVAELKSFVRAATELRIQNSLLSRRVARLEASLGVRLLQRTTRRVSLTQEGAQFLAETLRGLEQIHSAVDSLNSIHGVPKGKVRVSSGIEIGQYLVENLLPKFFDKYPEIQVEWELFSGNRNLIESGIDLAIRVGHSGEQSLIEKKIGSLSFQLFRSPKVSLNLSKKPTIEELEKLPWLIFSRDRFDIQRVKVSLWVGKSEVEIHPKNIRFRTNSLLSIRHTIINGQGIGLLPGPISDPEVATGRLVPILPNYLQGSTVDFYAVYPSKEYLAPKVRVLIDWLVGSFPEDIHGKRKL